ncbi:MAG: branched-chain amino acid transport system substrate-binding protein [Actinomycetota bacterium]|jgi:ABC-type branched-subunit amino acid transport system substrate-binding protein
MAAPSQSRFAGYAVALAALLITVAVASAGASKTIPVSATAKSEARTARAADTGATSSGIPLDDLQAASAGATTKGTTASGRAAATTPGGRHGIYDIGVTDTEIRIGGSTFTSGPAAVYGEQIAVGFAAGVNYINAHGGINGRKVVLKIYDDGADPAKQLANTKRLVEVDKVFALSMVYADIAGQYVAEKGIPVYHLGQQEAEFVNPWWFPVGGPQRLASYSLSNFGARKLGVKSVAILYLDAGAANYSKAYADSVAKDWNAYGVSTPVLAPFAVDQTSCSDAISKAKNAGVDFIDFEVDASKVINCGVEAQIQGYTPPKGWGGYLIGVPVIHEALGDFSEGMYAFDAFGALYDNPDYIKAVHDVSPKTETYSSVTMSYFVSAMLMRDSIAKLGDNITRTRLREVLNTFTNWQPGLTTNPNQPTWTWRPTCHTALKGGYVIQIQKHDNKLKWTQITPQFATTPVPPGSTPPAQYSQCNIFSAG